MAAREIANTALDHLQEEYLGSYLNFRSSLREVQLEADIVNIRRGEIGTPTTQLGYLKLDGNTYLRGLTTYAQIDLALGEVHRKMNDLHTSIAIPSQIITGIRELRKDDFFEEVIADDYYDHYNAHGYADKIRLIGVSHQRFLYIRPLPPTCL